MKTILSVFLIFTLSSSLHAQKDEGVAKAIIIKGKVQATYQGSKTELQKGSWIKEGTVLESEEKSFVKLLFIDKSQMSLGPSSKMAVTQFPKNDAGIISLMKGQLRSKVTKDYMNIKDQDKSKLFIKTKTAAMGVRGTDFRVDFNPRNSNTSLITFSGAVAMAQIPKMRDLASLNNQKRLERLVSSPAAVMVKKGQFSGVIPGKTKRATPPVKLNPAQLNTLKKNDNFQASNKKKDFAPTVAAKRAPIPPGVDSKEFSNNSNSIEKEMSVAMGVPETNLAPTAVIDPQNTTLAAAPVDAAGTADMGLKPGGFIDLNTVNYIPPPENSVYDAATETYIPPVNYGGFDPATGDYKNDFYQLTDDGTFVALPDDGGRLPASEGDAYVATGTGDSALLPPETITYIDPALSMDPMYSDPTFTDGTMDSTYIDNLAAETLYQNEYTYDGSLNYVPTGGRAKVNVNFNAQ